MLVIRQKSQFSSVGSSLKRVALVAAFLLSLGGAGLCEAENTLVVTYQSLATDTKLLTPEDSPVQESSACSTERTDVKAPQYLIIPTTTVDPATGESTTTLVYYEFVFWNINGEAYPTERATFLPDCGKHNDATAWYRVICDPNPLGCNGCGGDGLGADVFAFSLTDDKPIVGETPIESVTGATWTGPPATGITLPTVTATATVDLLSAISGYGSFVEYQLDGGPLDKSRDLPLKVGDFAIAFYHAKPTKPVPPPCPGGSTTCT